MEPRLSIVMCATCFKFEFRDKDPKKTGAALKAHYEAMHPHTAS
jgi:hypothetical protein